MVCRKRRNFNLLLHNGLPFLHQFLEIRGIAENQGDRFLIRKESNNLSPLILNLPSLIIGASSSSFSISNL